MIEQWNLINRLLGGEREIPSYIQNGKEGCLQLESQTIGDHRQYSEYADGKLALSQTVVYLGPGFFVLNVLLKTFHPTIRIVYYLFKFMSHNSHILL